VIGRPDKNRRDLAPLATVQANGPDSGPSHVGVVKVLGSRQLLSVSGTKYERATAIASSQRGRASRVQLLAAGISPSAIKRMLGAGFLFREHAGVYLVGHRSPVELGRETSALLACGGGAILSHRTAAALWQIHPADPTAPVAVLSTQREGPRPGIAMHHTLLLGANDVQVLHGLPITSPARTLVDNTTELTEREVERALDEALIQRLVKLNDVTETLDRLTVRRHAALLRKLIDDRRGSRLTRSQLEEIFLELIRKAGLPMPKVNYRLHGFTVDFYWPQYQVVFELDGYRFHSTHSAFERDRRKDRILKQAGNDNNRVTWRQLADHPLEVVVHATQRLAAARREAA
jgi:very-short-patch-repair endonuclease